MIPKIKRRKCDDRRRAEHEIEKPRKKSVQEEDDRRNTRNDWVFSYARINRVRGDSENFPQESSYVFGINSHFLISLESQNN